MALIAFGGVVVAGLSLLGGAFLVPWRLRGWLGDQFSSTRSTFYDAMKAHEDKDQERHEENLERFARIRVALARAGINQTPENGGPESDQHYQ